MSEPQEHVYSAFIGFRAPDDFLGRFLQFSETVGRSRSAVARYLIAQCLSAYEGDAIAISKIRQAIL
jgi:hypothetical protein